jgi:hypothetical protein
MNERKWGEFINNWGVLVSVLVLLFVLVLLITKGCQGPPPPTPAPPSVVTEKEVTPTPITPTPIPCDRPSGSEVECEFEEEGVTGPVSFEPITVTGRQPLQLNVIGAKNGITRTHFSLGIDESDYPPGSNFELQVKAFFNKDIAETCQEDRAACEEEHPEVSCVTKDGRLIILVDSTGYVVASPYAFSVTGIGEFANPITVSISVDIPPGEEDSEHGLIIYHEDDGTIEHFRGELIQEGDFFRVTNSEPITRCCACDGHCSSRATCLE